MVQFFGQNTYSKFISGSKLEKVYLKYGEDFEEYLNLHFKSNNYFAQYLILRIIHQGKYFRYFISLELFVNFNLIIKSSGHYYNILYRDIFRSRVVTPVLKHFITIKFCKSSNPNFDFRCSSNNKIPGVAWLKCNDDVTNIFNIWIFIWRVSL